MTAVQMTPEEEARYGRFPWSLPSPPPGLGTGAVFNGQFDDGPERRLPAPPPKARSSSPFGKENLSNTLLDIGSAFLSTPNFWEGLGNAGQAIRGRGEELKAQKPKSSFGGPDGQFEIIEDPNTGQRTIREVPEFAKAVQAERDAKAAERNHLDPKALAEMRARAVYAIGQLPAEQRPAAYAELLRNPQAYGGFSTAGMPSAWDDGYGQVMGNMGATVNQNRSYLNKEEDQSYREKRDIVKDGFTRERLDKPRSGGGGSGRSSAPKPPTGFILD